MMTKEAVLSMVRTHAIVPSIRVKNADHALFAAEAIYHGGIPLVEITMTIPDAVGVIERLCRVVPEMCVGAGTVLDPDTAQRCLDAGACFLTSTGLDLGLIGLAKQHGVAYFPGGMTPTEVITAWKAGADVVKVFPCAPLGGDVYIKTLRAPLPQVPMIASGGVTQTSAGRYLRAGAIAIGVGSELVPHEAIDARKQDQVVELARRFKKVIREAQLG